MSYPNIYMLCVTERQLWAQVPSATLDLSQKTSSDETTEHVKPETTPRTPTSHGTKTSSTTVFEYVRHLIIEGELEQGRKVPQSEIATTLGVSLIPVREALIALDRDGWVTLVPQRGAYVNPITVDTVRDHYRLGGVLYGMAVQLAAERATDEQLAELRRIGKRASTEVDITKLFWAMFDLIGEAAQSARLRVLCENHYPFVLGTNYLERAPLVANLDPILRTTTRKMTEALVRRNGDAAQRLCVTSSDALCDVITSAMRERNLLTDAAANRSSGAAAPARRVRKTN